MNFIFKLRITQDIFLKMHKNGFTSTSTLEQLHCGKCDKLVFF